jgi:hypothetical protein
MAEPVQTLLMEFNVCVHQTELDHVASMKMYAHQIHAKIQECAHKLMRRKPNAIVHQTFLELFVKKLIHVQVFPV